MERGARQVPPGYRNAAAAPPKAGTAATCPVNNEPDPLVLNSFDWVYLNRGYINATTDPERGCLFVVSGWYLEYPLGAYATVPLGLRSTGGSSTTPAVAACRSCRGRRSVTSSSVPATART